MLKTLPVIPLRGMVVLPGEVSHCDAGRKKTLAAIQAAANADGLAFVCAQLDGTKNNPKPDELERVGTICRVKQVFRLQNEGSMHMLLTGVSRAYAKQYISQEPYYEAAICDIGETKGDEVAVEALRRRLQEAFAQCAKLTGKLTSSQRSATGTMEDAGEFADMVAALFVTDVRERQQILEQSNVEQRIELLLSMLRREIQVLEVDAKINSKLHQEIEKSQKEHYLREKIRVIKKELGDDGEQEAQVFYERMKKKTLPESVAQRLKKEIVRFEGLPMGSHETPMARAYIECLLDLPWTEETKDRLDINHAQKILDKNHYGMERVKDRVLEYLAVQRLTGKPNGEILCFVGPPGVGKTSIVASIAEAMGRNFVRMSLGGVRDEAEIRGHRRTYIGAMPGRVIAAMRQAGSVNPVLLFDEIDKLASDFRGDPAAAMLELLDGAQNFAFKDHFLEIPYDMSKAMLLTTANDLDTIPRPLLDRMEVIHVESYLAEEKLQIAKRHLLKKQLSAHGLTKGNLRITDGQIMSIIQGYTREAGVRELERVLGAVCRKAAVQVVGGKNRVTINGQLLEEFLGKRRYHEEPIRLEPEVGVATGLAWTPVGGETLSIEAAVLKGSGNVQLTGKLGEVMQESARAALTYVRAHANEWGIEPELFEQKDIHLHVPQGAVPKDGPSAGAALAVAILSAFSGTPVKNDVAMTGEITLRGRVLPIGGVREKSLAALRAGITRVILPEGNRKDVEEIPEPARSELSFRFVAHLDDVFEETMVRMPVRQVEEKAYLPTSAPQPYHTRTQA
ncbi:endopeptidase La [Eubacteriales bacterium OttesenSCG-928-K08]|nr:endopeptidase La [Eubacteriales bacterium OttesenSCG-928-K08]